MQSLYTKVLEKITPSKQELLAEKKLVEIIKRKVSKIEGKHSHIEWCGSSARGTHLHGDRDIDLFLMFDKKLSSKELESEGLRVAKEVFNGHKWETAYSQHPYIRGEINGFEVEIVPSYIVKSGEEKQSAVDRTPFHNKYLLKNMKITQRKDARLLKQFLKGINIKLWKF
jgi:tRNA nucleotidyltransferase (CCA-adding enzyme)